LALSFIVSRTMSDRGACMPEDEEALFDGARTMIQATSTLITFIHFMSFFFASINYETYERVFHHLHWRQPEVSPSVNQKHRQTPLAFGAFAVFPRSPLNSPFQLMNSIQSSYPSEPTRPPSTR
jgi:hypothetical protein